MSTTTAELEALALARYRRRQATASRAILGALRLWRRLALGALTESWDAGTGRDLYLLTSAAQLVSAGGAGEYLSRALAIQDTDAGGAVGEPVPESLAGVSSSGQSLPNLLYQAVIGTKERIGQGMDPAEAFLTGGRSLGTIVGTQVADAGRVMDGVALHSRAKHLGYVRVLTPPSCARCAILAGRYYSSEKPFQRHPRCDCIHLPIGDPGLADDLVTSPKDYFASLNQAQQNLAFTKAGAQAIRDGADMNQVVNARSGMSVAGSYSTRLAGPELEGRNNLTVTHRGKVTSPFTMSGATLMGGRARLMPESIYRIASDQAEILRLLRQYGYLR